MKHYILSMGCVDGSDLQVRSYAPEDLLTWLKKCDHEGSSWSAVWHEMGEDMGITVVEETVDFTEQLKEAYAISLSREV